MSFHIWIWICLSCMDPLFHSCFSLCLWSLSLCFVYRCLSFRHFHTLFVTTLMSVYFLFLRLCIAMAYFSFPIWKYISSRKISVYTDSLNTGLLCICFTFHAALTFMLVDKEHVIKYPRSLKLRFHLLPAYMWNTEITHACMWNSCIALFITKQNIISIKWANLKNKFVNF